MIPKSTFHRRAAFFIKLLSSLALGLTILMFFAVRFPRPTEAAPSQFDQGFGTRGLVNTDLFAGEEDLTSIAVQSDGKILAAGSCETAGNIVGFCVVRYNANGTVDNSVVTPITGQFDKVNAIAVQADGKIVVGGVSGVEENFAVARYNANLTLDNTFGAAGLAVLAFPESQVLNDLAIQADGKIVVAGWAVGSPGRNFALARFNTNGTLDSSFGNLGVVNQLIGLGAQATSIAVQPDGKIVAAGFANVGGSDHLAVARYQADGTPDNAFDADGRVTTIFGAVDQAFDVVIQPDGKIAVAGYTTPTNILGATFALVRYNSTGLLDTTFDGDGILVPNFGHVCRGVALQADGKLVAVGPAGFNQPGQTAVVRVNPNGSLDGSFHGDGRFVIPPPGFLQETRAVGIQPDGKIVVGGYSDHKFVLHRLLGDPHQAFTNFNGMFPADRVGTNPPGLPSNYGSLGDINGLPGTVTKVRVTITNVSHTFPGDLDVVLVGPQGQKCILMSDAGGGNPGVTGRNYTFDQTAPDFPNTAAPSGTYKPFNYAGAPALEPGGIDVFPAPGPGSQNYGVANLDVFNGTNPNGIWRLYVVDDEAGDTGGISTWTIDVTTTTSRLTNLASDFDGDGRTDLSLFRDGVGTWYTINSLTNSFVGTQFGATGDRIVPADYDGDGRTDIAVWRPSSGTWYLLRSTSGFTGIQFGAANDLPAQGDYDGDGLADLVVFRPSEGVWYSLPSSGGFTATPFGQSGDKPVPGDYDGDGRTDIAVYRPSAGTWYLLRSTLGFTGMQFGIAADKVAPADYDGDGTTDLAVFRESAGAWYLLGSTAGFTATQFGAANDVPAPGDFDGDGKADINLFRPTSGSWFRLNSTNGGFVATQFGQNGDKPVPAGAVPTQ